MRSAQTQLSKWGSSLAVRIPKPILEAMQLREGDDLAIEVRDRVILIHPVEHKPTLADLVKGITQANRHSEIDWGPPTGNETW